MKKTQLNKGYLCQNRIFLYFSINFDFLLKFLRFKKRKLPAYIRKVLIVKPDHIGDLCMLTAVLPNVSGLFPEAKIDILIGEWGKDVLKNNPYINNKIIFNHIFFDRSNHDFIIRFFNFLKNYIKIIRVLRSISYDVALIMTAYPGNAVLLARLGGCKYIVGHSTTFGSPVMDNIVMWKEGRHEVEHFWEVVAPFINEGNKTLGDIKNFKYNFYFSDEHEFINNLFAKYGLSSSSYIVLHPGVGNRNRSYPINRWRNIAKFILNKGMKLLITGNLQERLLGKKLKLDNDIINLTGDFSLSQLYAVFKHARCILAVESAAAHIAATTENPTIVVWSGFTYPPQFEPLGRKVTLIRTDLECSPCYLYAGCNIKKCMEIEETVIINEVSRYIFN